MELEHQLTEQCNALSSLVERRRMVWRDIAAQDFERRCLLPLGGVFDEYRKAAQHFAATFDEALNELRR